MTKARGKKNKSEPTQSRSSNEHDVEIKAVDVEIDVPTLDTGFYQMRRVELNLDRDQRSTLRKVFDGLQYSGAMLASGKGVRTQQDAVRWMLEQVHDGLVGGKKS